MIREDMIISDCGRDDLGEILELQRRAYQREAERYGDFSIPPLTQTREELQGQFEAGIILKAVLEGCIIGSVRADLSEGICRIGRLIVHPDHQGKGVGTELLKEIEGRYRDTCLAYELFTGDRSAGNIRLYEKNGYALTGKTGRTGDVGLLFLQKKNELPYRRGTRRALKKLSRNTMKKPERCRSLEEIREAIDGIDRTIVEMIALRSAYVRAAAPFKNSDEEVRDENRVARVIASKRKLAGELGVSPDLIGSLYGMMIEYFIGEEREVFQHG